MIFNNINQILLNHVQFRCEIIFCRVWYNYTMTVPRNIILASKLEDFKKLKYNDYNGIKYIGGS